MEKERKKGGAGGDSMRGGAVTAAGEEEWRSDTKERLGKVEERTGSSCVLVSQFEKFEKGKH